MNGFQTSLIPELVVDHLKPRNVSQGGIVRRKFQLGVRYYALAYHPAFELVKCVGRTGESPFIPLLWPGSLASVWPGCDANLAFFRRNSLNSSNKSKCGVCAGCSVCGSRNSSSFAEMGFISRR
jgi:hypothetical protein